MTGYSLLVESQEEAEKLSNSIKKGENFFLLAMEYSQDEQTKRKGGYFNKLPGRLLPEDIREAVFNASPEEVVGPMKAPAGYQLFKVTEITLATWESAKNKIEFELYSQLRDKLRNKAEITFPFLQ